MKRIIVILLMIILFTIHCDGEWVEFAEEPNCTKNVIKEIERMKTELNSDGDKGVCGKGKYFTGAAKCKNNKILVECKKKNFQTKSKEKNNMIKVMGLTWSGKTWKMAWGKAKNKCKSLGLRLPTVNELEKLIYARSDLLDEGCNDISCNYWASDASLNEEIYGTKSDDDAYCVNILDDSGSALFIEKRERKNHVRCIR